MNDLGRKCQCRRKFSRLAALLARQALEDLVDERYRAVAADVPDASMRSILVILRALDTAERADFAAVAWNRLSSVCYHHAYELAPATAEVRHLCDWWLGYWIEERRRGGHLCWPALRCARLAFRSAKKVKIDESC